MKLLDEEMTPREAAWFFVAIAVLVVVGHGSALYHRVRRG